MPRVAEVVVVGGGVIGMTCAWRLAQSGVRVTVVERGRAGCGGSGAALGLLMPSGPTHKGPYPRLHRASLWSYPQFAAELRDASDIDIEYDRPGRIELLRSPRRREIATAEVAAAAADWPEQDGQPAQALLDAAEAQSLAPHLATTPYGALFCRATARVNVARLLEALVEACRRTGVRLIEKQPVTRIDVHGARVSGVTTSAGPIPADTILIAAGAWTSSLSPDLTRWAPITPVKGQAIAFAADKPETDQGSSGATVTSVVRAQPYYLLRQRDGNLLAGATSEADAGFDCRPTEQAAAEIRGGIREFFPAIEDMAVTRHWAGLRPKGADSRPFIGPIPGLEGLFVAAGHYKLGIGLAPITGEIIRDLMLSGATSHDLSSCRPGRLEAPGG